MAEEQQLDVIAVGAHPDDVEIACGGTLAKLVQQGYRVGIVDLTDGEPTPHSPGPEARLAEAQRAAEVLGVRSAFSSSCLTAGCSTRLRPASHLAKVFRRYRPRLVLGFGEKTPLASPDHFQAMQITDAAVFYSRLTKWDVHFDHLPVHPIAGYLYYTLAFHSIVPPAAAGHLVVDISDTLDKKLASIKCYATQFPPAKAHVFERVRAIALHCGAAAGYVAGELFSSPKVLGTRDLMSFLFGPEKPAPV